MFRFSKKFIPGAFFILAALTAAFFVFLGTPVSLKANNQRAITIHDGSKSFTVTTQAATVGDVLQRAEVTLGEHDLTEPAKDTPLTAPAYTVNVYRARPVTIIDGAIHKQIMSPYHSPRSIVNHAGVELYDEDIVTKERVDDFAVANAPGLRVELERAIPITLVLYGKQAIIRTQAKTVGDLLTEKKITLGEKDDTSKPLTTPIVAGMVLDIYRDGVKTETKEVEVAYTTRTIQDADRDVGFREVREAGENGRRTVTFQITLKNGVETARKEIQSVVTQQPKEEVVVVGTKREEFAGGLEAKFAALRQCESGGNYTNKNNPLYRGAYQFGYDTWANNGGYRDPADAPPALQDAAAKALYDRRGWQPWPGCSAKLGL